MFNTHSRLTISDVAKKAGVSTGTVSRVLNDRYGVKDSTKRRVLSVIDELGYRPDLSARELSRQPMRIGLSLPSAAQRLAPFFMLFWEALTAHINADGYRIEQVANAVNGLPEYLCDAMVLFGAHDDDPRIPHLQGLGVPFVLIGHQKGVHAVCPDDYRGARQACEHLLRLGHKDILFLSDVSGTQGSFDRYRGYRDALEQAQLPIKSDFYLNGKFSTLEAYRALRRFLATEQPFSAIFAASDEMALGAIAALEDGQLRIPLDVSVVGFDDLPGLAHNITTVRQDIDQIAKAAVDLLKASVNGEAARQITVPVTLIIRETTARRR